MSMLLLTGGIQAVFAGPVKYTYDAAGRLTHVDYGNGHSITYTYDAAGNLLRRVVVGVTPVTTTGGGGDDGGGTAGATRLAPTSANDAFTTDFGTSLAVPASGVLTNDRSNDGGGMTASLVGNTSAGTLTLSGDGGFSYSPNAGFAGTDTFSYRATNDVGSGNTAVVTITVNQPTTAQPPTELTVLSIVGDAITVRWNGPSIGPAATNFVVEGGPNPGEILTSLPTESTLPVFTFTAPTGAFYVRVHTISGASRSAASNEIQIFVNVPMAPSPPANLVGVVDGSSLGLTWRNTFTRGTPTSLMLDVTGAIVGSIPLALTESFSFADMPAGTFTFALRAINDAGPSAPSNAVTMTFPGGCSGPPLTPPNFVASASGATIVVAWDSAATGPAPTGYVLQVTGSFVGSFPTAARVMSGTAPSGTYHLSVIATNPCGSSAPTAVWSVTIP